MSGLNLINDQQPPFQLILNSRKAINKNDKRSVVQFSLPTAPEVTTDTQTCIVNLLHFYCPNSIYNITDTNNVIGICVVTGDYTPTYYTGYIPPGGYDINNVNPLLGVLNTFFQTFAVGTTTPLNGITCTFNSSNAVVTLDLSAWTPPTNYYGLYVLDTPNSVFHPLGFESSQTTNLPGLLVPAWKNQGNTILSTGIPSLSTPDIIMKIDQFNSHNRASGFGIGEVFHVIHPNCGFGDIIDYAPKIDFTSQIPRLNLEGVLTVRFVDWDNNEINWNGQDWTLTLGIRWAVDTGIAGLETVQFNQNLRPLTNHYPDHYDSLDVGGRERKRKLRGF